jgi:hypothetical protein
MLLAMSCASVRIKIFLEHHKKGKKRREEKIGLSSNTMEEELEIKFKNSFCPILNFRLYFNPNCLKHRSSFIHKGVLSCLKIAIELIFAPIDRKNQHSLRK